MDTMTTGERVAEAFWAGVGVVGLISFCVWFFMPNEPDQPSRYTILVRWFRYRYFPGASTDFANSEPSEYVYQEQELSSVFITSSDEIEADEQTDAQTDVGASALAAAISAKKIDVIKELMIDTLVADGADVAIVRLVVKGDNATVGAAVAASRERLGISLPERTLKVRDGVGEREIAF